MSAFTIAFLIPNTVRSLFADAAIQAAFVPVFTEKLEHGERREAFRLASLLLFLVTLVLGLITALFILLAPVIVPVFAPGFEGATLDLTVSLSRVLFPILILLGISGLVVGILNSYDRFSVFAIAPFFWNVAIVAVLIGLAPAFPEDDQIYAYAIGVVVGTVIQLAMLTYDLRNTPFGIRRALLAPFRTKLREAIGDPDVRRVLILMLPVTISLGLINYQPAGQQLLRKPRVRPGAGGDRQGLSHLHAAAGDLLRRGLDRPLPDPRPLRRPRGDRRPAGDDGERDAPDRPPAHAGGRRDPRALRADDPARLPARRVHRVADRRSHSPRSTTQKMSSRSPDASASSSPVPTLQLIASPFRNSVATPVHSGSRSDSIRCSNRRHQATRRRRNRFTESSAAFAKPAEPNSR